MQHQLSRTALMTRINAVLFKGTVSDDQRHGIERYVWVWQLLRINKVYAPTAYLAYILATVYHETAQTMQPVEEYGKGEGRDYGKPDPITGQVYYGRGDVQVTWKYNYQTLSELLIDPITMQKGVDLVNYPELLLEPIYSAQATILGMVKGIFTGRKLADYLDALDPDYVGARKIINGTDNDTLIADHAKEFHKALLCAFGEPISRDVVMIGENGSDVRELQILLNLQPDGAFGSKTQNAVMSYQKAKGLEADGICGRDTWRSLQKDNYW